MGRIEVFLVVDALFPIVDERLCKQEIPEIGDPGDRVHEWAGGLDYPELLEQLVDVLERLFHLVFDQLEFVSLQILLKNLLGVKLKRSEEHTSEIQSHHDLVCRCLLVKKKAELMKNQQILQQNMQGNNI